PDRREAALWSLGQIGRQPNETLRERVLDRLLAHFEGEELRQEAGAALVEAWGARIVAELSGRGLPPSLVRQGAEALAAVGGQLLLKALRVERDAAVLAALAAALDSRVVEIPAGEFLMDDEERKVYVDAFRIDKYPVTNAQYKRFVEATGHSPPRHWEGGNYPAKKAAHPVVYVTWHDAVAYAEWVGKRLPTEEQWEKAARGTDGRGYPWGDWEKGRCNTWEANIGDTTPVGKYSPGGDSPYGCVDMVGNVWEWTTTQCEPGHPGRVVRGGSWLVYRDNARCAVYGWDHPDFSYVHRGFRCVSPISP
ncbi:MAG: SUMF1/EgtB/PvdO family nonheme iron enzyme, partial [Anaerolineae bacterium]|nr:SUMF1/EgtB/PvdO family nonheme iron enzyme [Anaerolineae bacterium]